LVAGAKSKERGNVQNLAEVSVMSTVWTPCYGKLSLKVLILHFKPFSM
jgi:hypothetical protein